MEKEGNVRRFMSVIAASGLLGLLVCQGPAGGQPGVAPTGKVGVKKVVESGDTCPTDSCGSFGTSVQFVSTPSLAAQQALKEQKLVLVLHVSGDFENPDFT